MLQEDVRDCAQMPRRYRLLMRCHNCMRESAKVIDFGDDEDAPADVDELMESVAISQIRYHCADCDSAIGTIVGVNQSKGRRV